jgi:cell division protein FtsN
MARDYKHRVQSRSKKKPCRCGIWLVAGLLVGALGVGLAWLKLGGEPADQQWISDRPSPGEAESRRPAAPPPPRFDFYDRLPAMEVVVPDEALPQLPPVESQPGRDSDAPPAQYLVQVGSFKKAADADRLKAQLLLLGMEVRVSRVRIDDGDTWHRVRVGPFADTKSLEAARRRLAEAGMRSIVIRAAGG